MVENSEGKLSQKEVNGAIVMAKTDPLVRATRSLHLDQVPKCLCRGRPARVAPFAPDHAPLQAKLEPLHKFDGVSFRCMIASVPGFALYSPPGFWVCPDTDFPIKPVLSLATGVPGAAFIATDATGFLHALDSK